MPVQLRYQAQTLTSNYGRKYLSSSPHNSPTVKFSKFTTMNTMLQPKSKRPTCPNCFKPLVVCLCSRIKFPSLDNRVSVTILQHSLEKNHPLNSTRIVNLGLKNLRVVTVRDVNFEARFDVRLLDPVHQEEELQRTPGVCGNASERLGSPQFSISIEKYGKIRSEVEEVMDSALAKEAVARGFIVKKSRESQEAGIMKFEEEFEISIPPGTVVLFPAKDSVAVDDVGFDVKKLIVLDGTWGKANRIYNENPWLRLLPCVKLDMDKVSLYSEVRQQPKPGCLSTLESIVYALEAFGENNNILEGLNSMLQVFESMVEDQRRCQRLGRAPPLSETESPDKKEAMFPVVKKSGPVALR